MLGDKIGELQGQITSTRVLSTDNGPVIEASYQGAGNLLGVETTDLGTYESVMRPDGTLFGQGEGVTMTEDGEVVTWKGQGVGTPTGEGLGVSWRGAIYYWAPSEKLARLNSIASTYEFEVAEDGSISATIFEWK